MPATQTARTQLPAIYTGGDFRMHTHLTTPAILAARNIIAGDVSQARKDIAAHRIYKAGFTVAEARALAGACREANRRYSTSLTFSSFLA